MTLGDERADSNSREEIAPLVLKASRLVGGTYLFAALAIASVGLVTSLFASGFPVKVSGALLLAIFGGLSVLLSGKVFSRNPFVTFTTAGLDSPVLGLVRWDAIVSIRIGTPGRLGRGLEVRVDHPALYRDRVKSRVGRAFNIGVDSDAPLMFLSERMLRISAEKMLAEIEKRADKALPS
ncbi:MAG: hypothetical protein WBQ14_03500 [Gaiellaceae bacterium]